MRPNRILLVLLWVIGVGDACGQNQEYFRFGTNLKVPWQRHALLVQSELVSAQYLLRREPEGKIQYYVDLNPTISVSKEFFSKGFFDYHSVSDVSRAFSLAATGAARYFVSRRFFVSSGLDHVYENATERFNSVSNRRTSETSISGSVGWDSRDFVFFEFHDFDFFQKGWHGDLTYRRTLSKAIDGKRPNSKFMDRSLSGKVFYGIAAGERQTLGSMVEITKFLNERSRNETVSDLSLTMTSVVLKDKINDTTISLRIIKFPENDTPTRIFMFLTRFRFFPRNDLAVSVQGGLNVHLWESPSKEVSLGIGINYFLNTNTDRERPHF